MKGNVIITAERYLELLKAENELNALEAAGVDNWSGYGECGEYMDDEDGLIEEVKSKLV
jgi:hypothetical protein